MLPTHPRRLVTVFDAGDVKTISGQLKRSDLCIEHQLNVRLNLPRRVPLTDLHLSLATSARLILESPTSFRLFLLGRRPYWCVYLSDDAEAGSTNCLARSIFFTSVPLLRRMLLYCSTAMNQQTHACIRYSYTISRHANLL